MPGKSERQLSGGLFVWIAIHRAFPFSEEAMAIAYRTCLVCPGQAGMSCFVPGLGCNSIQKNCVTPPILGGANIDNVIQPVLTAINPPAIFA